jgi:hypothetical protein
MDQKFADITLSLTTVALAVVRDSVISAMFGGVAANVTEVAL